MQSAPVNGRDCWKYIMCSTLAAVCSRLLQPSLHGQACCRCGMPLSSLSCLRELGTSGIPKLFASPPAAAVGRQSPCLTITGVACMQLDLGNYAWALGKGFGELAARACPASEEDKETTVTRYIMARPQRLRVRSLFRRPRLALLADLLPISSEHRAAHPEALTVFCAQQHPPPWLVAVLGCNQHGPVVRYWAACACMALHAALHAALCRIEANRVWPAGRRCARWRRRAGSRWAS